MAREIIVYADESIRSGRYFSDFYGGVAVWSTDLEEVVDTLHRCARRENLLAELKWQKVSSRYCPNVRLS